MRGSSRLPSTPRCPGWCRLRAMSMISIRELHAGASATTLNQEWFIVENVSGRAFSTTGCTVAVGKGKNARVKPVGTLDPGFTLAAEEKVRVITGNPGKKAHGAAPAEDGIKNYHLFLTSPLLTGPGSVVAMSLGQHELARAVFDPKSKTGLAPANGA